MLGHAEGVGARLEIDYETENKVSYVNMQLIMSHYANMSVQYTAIFASSKNGNFKI